MGGVCSSASSQLRTRELRNVFNQYAEGGELRASGLAQLCTREQATTLDPAAAERLVKRFSRHGGHTALSYADFVAMVFDGTAHPFQAEWVSVLSDAHDLSRPLSHYFVASAYRVERRAVGAAEYARAYAQAVLEGVRCIELRVYSSGGPSPVLLERPIDPTTGAAPVALRLVLEAIAKALPTGHLPLILSLDVLAREPASRLLAPMLREVFGSRLTRPPAPLLSLGSAGADRLPSPESLRGKVLLRASARGDSELAGLVGLRPIPFRGSARGEQSALECASLPASALGLLLEPKLRRGTAEPARSSAEYSRSSVESASLRGGTRASTAGGAGGGSEPEGKSEPPGTPTKPEHSALTAPSLAQLDSAAVLQLQDVAPAHAFTAARVVRAAPDEGAAEGAAPLDPLRAWELGVQLAAVELDAPGLALDLHRAMFARNGAQGYVRKPEWLVAADAAKPRVRSTLFSSTLSIPDVVAMSKLPPRPQRAVLHLRLIGGVRAPRTTAKMPRSAYVRGVLLSPYGGSDDQQTRAAPVAGGRLSLERALAFNTDVAELSFLRIELHSRVGAARGKPPVGTFTTWLPAMAPGLRLLELTSASGELTFSLLCRVSLELGIEEVDDVDYGVALIDGTIDPMADDDAKEDAPMPS